MQVKLTSALAGDDFAHGAGDTVDFPTDEAVRMCVKGLARPADKEAEALLAKEKPKVAEAMKQTRKNRRQQQQVGLKMLREQAMARPDLEEATAE